MPLSFSPHIAIQVVDLEDALEFYLETFEAELIERTDAEVVLRCGPVIFHIEESAAGQTFFEFVADDLDEAREQLEGAGCQLTPVRTPEGEESFLVADPFGLKFHVYEG